MDTRGAVGHDTSGPTTDNAMTRSEEQLNVGTRSEEVGRARLRKYVVTENVTETVPVSREEVRVEREPITDANIGNAMDGPAISEEEHEVTLHAETPVVEKEAVPVERVRLDTETVTEQATVTEGVRKEQIDVDGVDETRDRRATATPAHRAGDRDHRRRRPVEDQTRPAAALRAGGMLHAVSEPTVTPIAAESAGFAGPSELASALEGTGYLPDEGLATAAYLALVMHRPLFLEGEAGVGKTALAHALAEVTGRPIYRLQCYEGLEASQALYDWDFGRQLLHLRAAEAAHAADDPERLEASLYDRRFLLARPLLQALEDAPSVLLVDEIDRADDEFEAFLLEVLSDFTISIPELGTVRADDAAARRPDVQPHPRGARRPQAPLPLPLAGAPRLRPRGGDPAPPAARGHRAAGPGGRAGHREAAHPGPAQAAGHRRGDGLGHRPAHAGRPHARPGLAARTLGAVLKYREDTDRVQALARGALFGG